MKLDPEAIRAFEHAGWQRAAGAYGATFAHASAQFAEVLLDAAGVGNGVRVLDLCCGTGVVTVASAIRGAAVTGLDFSVAMLAEARRAHPKLCFEEGDAEALPYADASFDAVVSNFGIHHIARPDRAIREAHRVLRPGGRVAITNWAAPADNIAWKLVFDAIAACGDPHATKAPASGGNLQTHDAVLRLLSEGGFSECRTNTVHRTWQVAVPRDILTALARGTVRTAALIASQRALPAIEAAVTASAAVYRRGNHNYAVPIAAILACGTRMAGSPTGIPIS